MHIDNMFKLMDVLNSEIHVCGWCRRRRWPVWSPATRLQRSCHSKGTDCMWSVPLHSSSTVLPLAGWGGCPGSINTYVIQYAVRPVNRSVPLSVPIRPYLCYPICSARLALFTRGVLHQGIHVHVQHLYMYMYSRQRPALYIYIP